MLQPNTGQRSVVKDGASVRLQMGWSNADQERRSLLDENASAEGQHRATAQKYGMSRPFNYVLVHGAIARMANESSLQAEADRRALSSALAGCAIGSQVSEYVTYEIR